MTKIDPRTLSDLCNVIAGQSRDQFATPLYRVIQQSTMPRNDHDKAFCREMGDRTGLVMQAFFTGAATMLKLLHGDADPLPLEADHVERLRGLLSQYGLLADQEKTPL